MRSGGFFVARGWIVLVISVFMIFPAFDPASGEEAKKEPISLKQAIDMAVSNNPGLKAAGFQVEAADAGVMKARSGYLPRIDVSEIYQRTTNPMWAFGHKLNQESIVSADFAPSRLNNPDPIDNWGTTLSLTQPIYTGGKVSAYHEQARLNREASLKDQERMRQEVVFEVTRAYYGIALAEATREVVKEALLTAEANMEMANSLFKAGVVVESDFLRARVNWGDSMEDDIRAANAVILRKAQLNNVMGVEIDAQYEPSERLDGDLEKMGAEYGLVHERGKQIDPTADRPDYARIRLREGIMEKGVEAARADYLPTIGFMANYEIDGADAVSGDGTNWTVMGVLKWNLFSGYENTAKVNEARAESNRMKEIKREMENGIRLEALTARLELKAARDRVYVAKDSVKQAEEGYRIVKNRYNEGMTTMVDLLSAGTALKKAKLNLTQALYDYKVGEARLKLALGILK